MQDNQDVTHVRGDDLKIPVTVSLDQSRTLDGTETWKWVLRERVTTPVLLTKTSPAGITIDGTTFQPTIVLAAADFLVSAFPDSVADQKYVHELEMTKGGNIETVTRGTLTIITDVVAV